MGPVLQQLFCDEISIETYMSKGYGKCGYVAGGLEDYMNLKRIPQVV